MNLLMNTVCLIVLVIDCLIVCHRINSLWLCNRIWLFRPPSFSSVPSTIMSISQDIIETSKRMRKCNIFTLFNIRSVLARTSCLYLPFFQSCHFNVPEVVTDGSSTWHQVVIDIDPYGKQQVILCLFGCAFSSPSTHRCQTFPLAPWLANFKTGQSALICVKLVRLFSLLLFALLATRFHIICAHLSTLKIWMSAQAKP